jgi:enamine deaminase RidA (YjgF/YER057c/UK114 family)
MTRLPSTNIVLGSANFVCLENCAICQNIFFAGSDHVSWPQTKREGEMTAITELASNVGNVDRRAALAFWAVAASVVGLPNAHAQAAGGALKTYNPSTVAAPLGAYSHAVEVPPNARWLYIAGQIGNAPDGSMAADVEGQAEQCWKNIEAILAAAGMGVENLVKCTHYLTHAEDAAMYSKVRTRHLGDARPASIFVVVTALARPGILLEVEAVAAKA